jgi:hypothetical protein
MRNFIVRSWYIKEKTTRRRKNLPSTKEKETLLAAGAAEQEKDSYHNLWLEISW